VEQYPVILLAEKEITFCKNDSISIQGFVQDSEVPVVFAWRTVDYLRDTTSASNKFAGPVGDYIKKFTATTLGASCNSIDSMQIHILPTFEIAYGRQQDTMTRYGDAIELTSENEAVMWVWTPGKISVVPHHRCNKRNAIINKGENGQYLCCLFLLYAFDPSLEQKL
jgi:hypothetical protein